MKGMAHYYGEKDERPRDAKPKKWIAGAIKHPGSFTASAERAGKGTMSYAREKQHAGGTLGKRARLALTLAKMHRK